MEENTPTAMDQTEKKKHKNEHDHSNASSSDSPSPTPRKRSHSILHWMQKKIDHAKTHRKSHEHEDVDEQKHDRSPPRQRSATTSVHSRPPVSFPVAQSVQPTPAHGRARSSTTTSVTSTGSKRHVQKKIISDTDQAAQQSPSIFQFVFMR